jgi:radical SAM/Cys-rich protein
MIKSLHARQHKLSAMPAQLRTLNDYPFDGTLPPFSEQLKMSGEFPLKPLELEILQVNVGYMCNQTCKHCHVDAGPDRKEIMTRETMQLCLKTLRENKIKTVDLTGGAPEMNPDFRWFIQEIHKTGVDEIIVRSNLTIILANPKYHDLPEFFRKYNIRVVSSLPFYQKEKTDRQRGTGVFQKSIEALKMLNNIGYGKAGSGLILDLVYNPSGAFLPGDQALLERDFKKELKGNFNIDFNSLFTITNMPVSRFLEFLVNTENYEEYMEKLVMAYNPAAIQGLMCRNTISVDFDGYLYDCDFNQMLGMKIEKNAGQHLKEFNMKGLRRRKICVNQHCYGCTAGAGSSCQGTVT